MARQTKAFIAENVQLTSAKQFHVTPFFLNIFLHFIPIIL